MPLRPSTPDAYAPLAPSPLGWFRRFGAANLNRDLWGEDFRNNPLFIYITGRGGVARRDDAMSMLPWLLLVAFAGWLLRLAYLTQSIHVLLILQFLLILIFPTFCALVTGLSVWLSFRRLVHLLPFEELLLTRLKKSELVHGIVMSPLSVQSGMVHVFVALNAVATLAGLWLLGTSSPRFGEWSFVLLSLVYCYYMGGLSVELGAAMAVRALLFVRGGWPIRFLIDWTLTLTGLGAAVYLFLLGFCCGGLGIVLTLLLVWKFSEDHARIILEDTALHAHQWWPILNVQGEEVLLPGPFTPWRRILRHPLPPLLGKP